MRMWVMDDDIAHEDFREKVLLRLGLYVRNVFGSERSCPTSFIDTTDPSATVTARASTRAFTTSSIICG